MTRDGFVIVIPAIIIVLLLWVAYSFMAGDSLLIIASFFSLILLFVLWFFRDPDREFSGEDKDIVSPADGTIVKIDKVYDPEYFKKEVTIVSIFLSVFNVHVNRWPYSGKLDYFRYHKGKFLAAFNPKASVENEQTILAIKANERRLLFKQIAGIIARRIICRGEVGDEVARGERFGMIRFGSRVDMLFEDDVEVKVKMKQKVKCGKTLIATYK